MDWLWKKLLYRWFPQSACTTPLDLIQYVTERKWNAKFWRMVDRMRFPDIYKK